MGVVEASESGGRERAPAQVQASMGRGSCSTFPATDSSGPALPWATNRGRCLSRRLSVRAPVLAAACCPRGPGLPDPACQGPRLRWWALGRRRGQATPRLPRAAVPATLVHRGERPNARPGQDHRPAGRAGDSACRTEPRGVSRVTDEIGVAWPTVMRMLRTTLALDTGVERRHVRHLGIDEHRFPVLCATCATPKPVRRRRVWELHQRRGRASVTLWK